MFRIVRWLLVAVFPLAGLYTGSRYVDTVKPAWERDFPQGILGLGFIEAGKTFLIADCKELAPGGIRKLHALIGIEAATGAEQFRKEFPPNLPDARLLLSITLSQDDSSLLCINYQEGPLVVFDWKKNEMRGVYQTGKVKHQVNMSTFVFQDRVVAPSSIIDSSGKERFFHLVWDLKSSGEPTQLALKTPPSYYKCSLDGRFTALCNDAHDATAQVIIIDNEKNQIIQTIPSKTCYNLRFSDDGSQLSLLALIDNTTMGIYRYDRQGKETLLHSFTIPNPFISFQSQRHYVYYQRDQYHPLRLKLAAVLDDRILNHFWTVAPAIFALDPMTGAIVRFMNLPNDRVFTKVYADDQLRGFMTVHLNGLVYWSFAGPSRWTLWLGFLTGLLLSAVLALANLKSSTKLTKR